MQLAGPFITSKVRSRKELTRKNWSEPKCRGWDVWRVLQRPVGLDRALRGRVRKGEWGRAPGLQ